MAIIPTITFTCSVGKLYTVALSDIWELKQQDANTTKMKTGWNEYTVNLHLEEINNMCNYSNLYAKEWNSSGKEPTHLGDTPFPYGAWETL